MFPHTVIEAAHDTTVFATEPGETASPPTASALPDGPLTFSESTIRGALRDDVARFVLAGESVALLPLVAASVRHGQVVSIAVTGSGLRGRLDLDPRHQVFDTDLPLLTMPDDLLARLRVYRADDGAPAWPADAPRLEGNLSALIWRIALRGSYAALLPEIAQRTRYRLAAGRVSLPPDLPPAWHHAVERLREAPMPRSAITGAAAPAWRRVLNAIYLHGGLIAI